MSDAHQTMTRYLLGELSESERTVFEAAYFEDPRILTELAEIEDALIDDYVRARLPLDVRRQFERVYLAQAERRERVEFAQALVARLDGSPPVMGTAAGDSGRETEVREWMATLFNSRPALSWSLAGVLLVAAVSGGLWVYLQPPGAQQAGPTLAPAPVEPSSSTAPVTPVTPSSSSAAVVLALTVGPGVRGNLGSPVSLVVPSSASEVRLDLSLDDTENDRFGVSLRRVGGADVLRRDGLRRAPSGPAFSFVIPADGLPAGDYLLTFRGAKGGDPFEDLSQTLIRVDRTR